jgi:hypothetical protein
VNLIFPLLAALIALLFAGFVFRQYTARRRPYQLAWTAGLVLFTVAAGAEYLSGASGWTSTLYRVYYVASATLVAYLALGTVYLLASRRVAHAVAVILVLLTGAMLVVAFQSPLDQSVLSSVSGHAIGGQGWAGGSNIRAFSPLFTIPGSLVLIGGALYSAYGFWRKQVRANLLVGHLLIAAGALILAGAGGFARLGQPEFLYVGELLGIVVMFGGFLRVQAAPAPVAQVAQ